MGATISIVGSGGGLTEAEFNARFDARLAQSSVTTQPPDFPSDPTGFQDGMTYRNTTDGKLYIKRSTGFEPVESGEDNFVTSEW